MSFARNLLCRGQFLKLSQKLCKPSSNVPVLSERLQPQVNPLFIIPLQRTFTVSSVYWQEDSEGVSDEKPVDPAKDRRNPHPVETSIRYIASEAYQKCYGEDPVWKFYRRNHKGMFAPRKTRRTCIRNGIVAASNPCPICRDEYLIIHPYNVKLLEQFISPFNGEILSYTKTGVCQKQHRSLLVAIAQAKSKGLITFDVPFREYEYKDYIPMSV